MESRGTQSKLVLREEIRKKFRKEYLEELVGENLFFVLGKEECLYNHYLIAKDLHEYCEEDEYGEWSALGWIITRNGIRRMKERTESEGA